MKYAPFAQALMLLLISATLGCKSSSQPNSNQSIMTRATDIAPFYKISASTRMFIAELNQIINEQQSNIDSYQPTDEFVKKYNLRQNNGRYYVHGFMKTTPEIALEKLEEKGIIIGAGKANTKTVQVPINALNYFFTHPQITYFEMATAAGTKK